ncbi:MAG: class I SAM-dependent methyltransferase [Candidatus Sericytochromatia bacterium]|nr:class I SAM-dependent methyltransferase [Candidatus Sericytochromatia bacterium]
MSTTKPHRRLRLAGFGLIAGAAVSPRLRKGLGFLGLVALVGAWWWRKRERLVPPTALLAGMPVPDGSHIVEIGAGEFPWLAAIGRLGQGLTVHAVSGTVPGAASMADWQQQIQGHVRHLQSHTRFEAVTADARTLPLQDRVAQLVILHEVLERYVSRESRRQAVFDAARILAPGGRMLIGEPRFISEAAAALTEAGLSVTAETGGWLTATKPWS